MNRHRVNAFICLAFLATPPGVTVSTARADLLVSSKGTNSVLDYAETTGSFLGTFASNAGFLEPGGLAVGPDGNLYVSFNGANTILRFSGADGHFLGVFASTPGIRDFAGIVFGPDGNLYVNSHGNSAIMRYDGITGAPRPAPGQTGAIFVPPRSGGLSAPSVGITFGLDGNLYVNSHGSNAIMRYDGSTGLPLPAPGQTGAIFIPRGSGNADLSAPASLTFGPDGRIYVTTHGRNPILRFDAAGNFVDDFAPPGTVLPRNPTALTFGPDGNLYIASQGNNRILRYDGQTGEGLPAPGQTDAIFIPQGSGRLSSPNALLFFSPSGVPEPGTLPLLGLGLLGVLGYGWHRRRKKGN